MSKKATKVKSGKRAGGTLYMVATPIGNLGDISDRTRRTLDECDVIAAEDTRVARKLLQACGLQGKKVISVREHNERGASMELGKTHSGKSIAYVSDAGTPSVSDPGAIVATTLRQMGFAVVPIPGPSSVTAALSASGMAGQGHVFAGFLPRRKEQFIGRLLECCSLRLPVVLFESPRRVGSALSWIAESLGDQTRVCMCRELTKMYEDVAVDIPARLIEKLADGGKAPKGEFTLVIEAVTDNPLPSAKSIEMLRTIAGELPVSKASKIVAKLTGEDARKLYDLISDERKDAS